MKVVYVKAPFQFQIRETEIPKPNAGQVLIELLQSKVIDPEDFITHTFNIEETEHYFKKQRDNSGDIIKMVMNKK